MADSTLAQLILSQRAPDIVGAFREGREEQRTQRTRTLTGEALRAGGGEALDELRGINPEVALALGETIRAQSAADINDFIRDAGIGKNMLETGNVSGFIAFAEQRSNILRQQGRDTTQTDRVLNLAKSGQSEQALQELQAISSALAASKGLTASEQEFQSLTKDLSPEDVERAKRVKLGLEGRASSRRTVDEEAELTLRREQAKEAIKLSRVNLDLLKSANKSIANIDDAIDSIDRGAETGVIVSKLPSVTVASIELENIGNRMGLDVVGATTFGALSESELAFALAVALPKTLNPKALRKWLVAKKKVHKKLASEMRKAAIFFGRGGTIPDFLENQTEREGKQGTIDPAILALTETQETQQPGIQPPPVQPTGQPAQRNIEVTF